MRASGSCARWPAARTAVRSTPAEVAPLKRVFDKARPRGYTPRQSLQFAIAAMLVSPQFLFRDRARSAAGHRRARHRDVELASRLSYFLWSSMPDEELLRLARSRTGCTLPAVLDAQVKRMLADPKAAALADNFAGQWLETRSLDAVKPRPDEVPRVERRAARTPCAPRRACSSTPCCARTGPLSDFIDGKYTFLNERLAKHYGIAGVDRTRLPPRRADHRRAQRRVHAGERADRVELSHAHVGRAARQVPARKHAQRAAAAAARRVPALDETTIGVAVSLRAADGAASRRTRCARAATPRWTRWASASRTTTPSAAGARRTASSRWTPSGTFPDGKTFRRARPR